MPDSVIAQISKLRRMSVGQLRDEWLKLYGEPTRSRNKQFLYRRLAWRVQEIAYGGLSDRALARIDELAKDGFRRARTPKDTVPVDAPTAVPRRKVRDINMPTPGSVISKQYKGAEIRVTVRDDGFEYDGTMYKSLTAIAKAVTGSKSINGKLFFGLTKRRR